MKLRKCKKCGKYSIKEICGSCSEKNSEAHYKFLNLRDAPKSNVKIVRRN
jgi:recombinational DNA repair protein RecR